METTTTVPTIGCKDYSGIRDLGPLLLSLNSGIILQSSGEANCLHILEASLTELGRDSLCQSLEIFSIE